MDNKFLTKVNDTYEFNFSKDEVVNSDILKISDDTFHFIKDNKSYNIKIVEKNLYDRSYTLKVNANTYKVDISNDLDLLINELGLEVGKAHLDNEIKAPMPGLILEINVSNGEEVKEGQALLVLEAMKMENTITSPKDGVIKYIGVTKGLSVAKNELLIEFE
jgi:biotin carboxyl carrier protein